MSLKRTIVLLGAGILALMGSMPAAAQDVWGLQLFAPAEVTPYGQVKGPPAREGFFFSWENLRWSVSKPDIATIGVPDGHRVVDYNIGVPPDYELAVQSYYTQYNSMDTGALEAFSVSGDRFEFGRIIDHHGWMFSGYRLKPQTQMIYGSDTSVVFNDPQDLLIRLVAVWTPEPEDDDPPEPPAYDVMDQPVIFSEVVAKNTVETWSVELMYMKRSEQMHRGGYFELFGGVRYMEFNENFEVRGSGPDVLVELGTLDALNDSFWSTSADNHIVGPQIGLRWFNKRGRWMISTEGRFLAGYNSQTIRQQGTLGSKALPNSGFPQTGFNSRVTSDEFSPCAELRADLRWQATSAISFRAGWTGVWIGNIARPSGMINYEVPYMGIDMTHNRQDVFINGFTVGVDINR